MSIDAKIVKALRDKTGAGMMDCKKALLETDGNLEKAVDYLRKSGITKAEKKGERTAKEGLIFSYIHHGGRLGVLVEMNCETDFVAKTEGYSDLAHNLAMQIAATNPLAIRREDIDQTILDREKEIYTDQAKDSGKPENIIEKIVEGRIEKFYAESCLLEQSFIKDPERKVSDLVTEAIATLGENIVVNRFTRYAIGEASLNGQPR
ncbi:MAG: translation elongation factor Ts [Candidatus Marinimicrobia bacterium]|jgi:elongation factor Ts|nr:translation elongation factor Ts [Candidatus Neomarinimicrobiota bacterium]|tara:strand:- start:312 stop:929 length:618 start_codon:yes stop_codon:yes gene_type:complete